jgi:hypothetical protein
MRSTTSKAKSGGASNTARSGSNRTGILVFPGYSVNHVLVQWRNEAARLWSEYQRTGHPSHLRAFRIHRAAMGGRLRSCMTA